MNHSEPFVIGWAHTPFGRFTERDTEALVTCVIPAALAHAEIGFADIDGIFVGAFNAGLSAQGFEAALPGIAEPQLASVAATRVENACATGSAAIFAANDFLASGRGKVALVVGVEQMTSASADRVTDSLLTACYRKEETRTGSFAGIFGEIAAEYFRRYGDHRETLAEIAAKNHANGVDNPLAHIRKDLGVTFCATVSPQNPRIAGPLLRTDCAPVSDGAAALVIGTGSVARRAPRAVSFRGQAQRNDHLPLSRRDPLEFAGARAAFMAAMDAAGVTPTDLDLMETHDCFTIAELLQYEAFGLAPRGAGRRALDDGLVSKGGSLPINPSGGLKARGHPIGATGVSMHVQAAMQVCDEAGAMQVPGACVAAVFNMGGTAVTNYCSVLERVR